MLRDDGLRIVVAVGAAVVVVVDDVTFAHICHTLDRGPETSYQHIPNPIDRKPSYLQPRKESGVYQGRLAQLHAGCHVPRHAEVRVLLHPSRPARLYVAREARGRAVRVGRTIFGGLNLYYCISSPKKK